MFLPSPTSTPLSRRRWIQHAGAASLAAATLPLAPGALAAQPSGYVRAHGVRTPDEALERLVEGNRRFVEGRPEAANLGVANVRALGTKQTPFASILSCADSRVPTEILFDQGFGDLFVTRVAGNIATSEVIGSLEYGSHVLEAQLVMVLGHTACGAVSATIAMGEVPGQIGSLFPYIQPAADEVEERTLGEGTPPIDAVIEENVRHQVNILRRASPVLSRLSAEGALRIVGGVFHFDTGLVEVID